MAHLRWVQMHVVDGQLAIEARRDMAASSLCVSNNCCDQNRAWRKRVRERDMVKPCRARNLRGQVNAPRSLSHPSNAIAPECD
jgi:hypothetical protein